MAAELSLASEGQGVACARSNRTRVYRRSLRDLLSIDSKLDFHRYGIEHAVERYRLLREEQGLGLGTVLSIGSTYREARRFVEHPFDEIRLTGILDSDDELREIAASDPRVRYEKQNCERLSYASGSFDLVFCKESLHHLARPVQGLYELLRVCRGAVLVLEPYDSQLDGLLRKLGLNTVYESNQLGNLELRDNFVYRWDRKQLEFVLKSLYLESGSSLELTLGWMSSRFNGPAFAPAAAFESSGDERDGDPRADDEHRREPKRQVQAKGARVALS